MFNMFFSDCQYMPQLRRYSPTKLCDGAKMMIICILDFQRAWHKWNDSPTHRSQMMDPGRMRLVLVYYSEDPGVHCSKGYG